MATPTAGTPAPPRAIAKLPEHVVNRIAAGEIIQRPSNALKELIENALDAGATTIRITVKEGGLKLLQIQDNGSGIRKDDLPILCERFTTSKIKAFEDLSSLGTYGFRGEALASISHVAHLSVTTKTKDETCAWKAAYSDGAMVPVKSGSNDAAPVPCAGNDGTVLSVEDLFFNTPQRLKALRSPSDEYARIVSVVLAYAIHNAGIAMSCKKVSSGPSNATADINTSVGASTLDNIGAMYGEQVKRELVEVAAESAEPNVKLRAWCSGANYQAKKGTYLFFINHRFVDCTPLKRALESFYGTLLAKGTYPFVYLSLELDPTKVDPNVHPTKKEVGFEDEDEIVEFVCEKLAERLASQGESRSFKVQTLLPAGGTPKPARTMSGSSSATPAASASRKQSVPSTSTKPAKKVAPNKLVRTDAQSQTLDALFPTLPSASTSKARAATGEEDEEGADDRPSKKRKSDHDPAFAAQLAAEEAAAQRSARVRIAQSECALTSVRQLRKEVLEARHLDLEAIVKGHIFVGVADLATAQSMIQHQTKLYLANHGLLAEELFYQLGLRQFGRFSRIRLKPAPDIRKIVRLAVERASAGGQREGKTSLTTEEIVERVYTTLFDARAMLDEYFALRISDDGALETLPLILPGYEPDLHKLPLFLLRLGAHVDWTAEKPCFASFLRELAFFHSPLPSPSLPPSSPEDDTRAKHSVQHVLWPALRQYLVPPETLVEDKAVVMATSLEALYRVFERC
ncbi:DNA mismatch repair protein Mlh1 [Rhodotorula kratochvilovae]